MMIVFCDFFGKQLVFSSFKNGKIAGVCSWTPTLLRPWYEVCFLGFCCVDATQVMGVMGWGGGDGNVP